MTEQKPELHVEKTEIGRPSKNFSLNFDTHEHRYAKQTYNQKADYDTDTRSYGNELAKWKYWLYMFEKLLNKLVDRTVRTKKTSTIDLVKTADWNDGANTCPEDMSDFTDLEASVIFSPDTKEVTYPSLQDEPFTLDNGTEDFMRHNPDGSFTATGVWSPDFTPVFDGIGKKIEVINEEITEINTKITPSKETHQVDFTTIVNEKGNSIPVSLNLSNAITYSTADDGIQSSDLVAPINSTLYTINDIYTKIALAKMSGTTTATSITDDTGQERQIEPVKTNAITRDISNALQTTSLMPFIDNYATLFNDVYAKLKVLEQFAGTINDNLIKSGYWQGAKFTGNLNPKYNFIFGDVSISISDTSGENGLFMQDVASKGYPINSIALAQSQTPK